MSAGDPDERRAESETGTEYFERKKVQTVERLRSTGEGGQLWYEVVCDAYLAICHSYKIRKTCVYRTCSIPST